MINPSGQGGREGPLDRSRSDEGRLEGRKVTREFALGEMIFALKLHDQLGQWGKELAQMQALSEEEFDHAPRAWHLFTEDMSPKERLRVINLEIKGGDQFRQLALVCTKNCETKQARLAVYEKLLKPVTSSGECFIDIVSKSKRTLNAATLLFQFPENEWESVLKFANFVVGSYFELDLVLEKLQKAEHRQEVMNAVYILEQHYNTPNLDKIKTLDKCLRYNTEELSFFELMRGFGLKREKEEFLKTLHALSYEQRRAYLPILRSITAKRTPIAAVKKVLWELYVDLNPLSYILYEFYYSLRLEDELEIETMPKEGPVLKKLITLISKSTSPLEFEIEGEEDEPNTEDIFERACEEIPDYFEEILALGPKGYTLKEVDSESAYKKASELGGLLYFMMEHGLTFAKKIRLAPQFFFQLARPEEEFQQVPKRRTIAWTTANALYYEGKALPSIYIQQTLCSPMPLPPPYKTPFDPYKLRIPRHFYTDTSPIILALFSEYEDPNRRIIKKCSQDPSFEASFAKAAPLFTERDSAEHRLQLIDLAKDLSKEQIQSASRLILEGDSIEVKTLILKQITVSDSKELLPICLEDSVEARLAVAQAVDGADIRKTASLFPPTLESDVGLRIQLITTFANAGFDELSQDSQEKLLCMIGYTPSTRRAAVIKLLEPLKKEELQVSLDYFDQYELDCFSLFAHKLAQDEPAVANEALELLSKQFAKQQIGYIQQARDFIYPDMQFPAIAPCFITLCKTEWKAPYCDLIALYKEYSVVCFNDLVRELYLLSEPQRKLLFENVPLNYPTPNILQLFNLTDDQRVFVFETMNSLLEPDDIEETAFYIFDFLCKIEEFEDIAPIRHAIQSFLTPSDTPEQRFELYERILIEESSSEQVTQRLTSLYCILLKKDFPNHVEEHVDIEILDGPVIPQLFDYLDRPLELIMHIHRPNDPGIDYGGPTREILARANQEIREVFAPYWMIDDQGLLTIHPDTGTFSEDDYKACARLGRLLFLMALNQVPLDNQGPEGQLPNLSPELFVELASYPLALLNENSLADCIHACGDDEVELQRLYRSFYPTVDYLPDDEEEIIAFLKAKEPRFQIARALSHDGRTFIRPFIASILIPIEDIRGHLSKVDTWVVIKDLPEEEKGDIELLMEYFFRWIAEAPDENIINLLYSMTGYKTCGPGKLLKLKICETPGAWPSTCQDELKIPPIPNAGEEDSDGLRNYDQWKTLIMDDIPIQNWTP